MGILTSIESRDWSLAERPGQKALRLLKANCLTTNPIASDGHLMEGDYYVPEENGGSMYYTFYDNGYLLLTFNAMDGTVATVMTGLMKAPL